MRTIQTPFRCGRPLGGEFVLDSILRLVEFLTIIAPRAQVTLVDEQSEQPTLIIEGYVELECARRSLELPSDFIEEYLAGYLGVIFEPYANSRARPPSIIRAGCNPGPSDEKATTLHAIIHMKPEFRAELQRVLEDARKLQTTTSRVYTLR